MSCAAPDQNLPAAAAPGATLIEGTVSISGEPVGGAYVRLHDATGEFTAEVVASTSGRFRFYAAPGTWEVRVLSPRGNARQEVTAEVGVTTTELVLG
ncbi:DUF1416 domain-containing protein [Sanguibacter antarcticus]|uniref:Uncharacterized protein DUF1416 n=1 Tax=Sanguibacter antarcticus TaxID=372484 RepID=A0A2A9E2U6_9MICO|nr:DUF1416 domain-containing protein [Sanguibacter antarcticus]PFG32976.1 uncharacterized protein DUF1416 [Sanguibacter antarcticus]